MDNSDFKTLSSLAFLSVSADTGKDYVSYFESFVKAALASASEFDVSVPQVMQSVKEESGFSLPAHVVDLVLKRLVKQGILDVPNAQGLYTVTSEDGVPAEYLTEKTNLEKKIAEITKLLSEHAKTLGVSDWADSRSESALFDLIDEYSRPLLNNAVFGVPLKLEENIENENRYVFATFANQLEKQNTDLFSVLIEIVKGSMAANAVLYRNPERVRARVNDLRLFLDTGFVLMLLGYEGRAKQEILLDSIKIAKKAGAKLRIFSHTLDEAILVLSSVADKLHNPQGNGAPRGGVFHNARAMRWTSSDLRRFALTLETDLKKLGVRQEELDLNNFQPAYAEADLEDRLQTIVKYRETSTRARDIRSISGVMKIRGALSYSDIENSKAIFVTTNSALMIACLNYFGINDLILKVPVVITSEILTNLLWLKNPDLGENIPRAKVVANIAAGLSVPERTWKKYLKSVDRLSEQKKITSDDVTILRYSSMAPKEIMAITHGRDDEVSEVQVENILEQVEKRIASNEVKKLLNYEKLEGEPRKRLINVLKILAHIPSVVISIALCTTLYYTLPPSFNIWAQFFILNVIPSAVAYWGLFKHLNNHIFKFLKHKFVGSEEEQKHLGLE